jgi:MFS family permease
VVTVFHGPSPSLLGIFGALPGFGILAAVPFAPYVADNIGRRNGSIVGILIIIMGALLQAFPPASHPLSMYIAGTVSCLYENFLLADYI